MIKTLHQQMVRGQTLAITRVSLDDNGRRRDLTGASIFCVIRADVKVPPTIMLCSATEAPETWRTGIVISDQTTDPGQFVITLIPDDTDGVVALGHDDPWLYEVWIILDGARIPEISPSNLDIYSEGITFPS